MKRKVWITTLNSTEQNSIQQKLRFDPRSPASYQSRIGIIFGYITPKDVRDYLSWKFFESQLDIDVAFERSSLVARAHHGQLCHARNGPPIDPVLPWS
jgi:hypothetical protein